MNASDGSKALSSIDRILYEQCWLELKQHNSLYYYHLTQFYIALGDSGGEVCSCIHASV